MIVTDTSALIALMKKTPAGTAVHNAINGEQIALTSITCFEILNKAKETEMETRKRTVSNLKIFTLDAESAITSAKIANSLRKNGKTISALDLFIAAICINNNLALITLDKDFENIPNLNAMIIKP